MALRLVVANLAYSSWSARPWLVATAFGIPFEQTTVPLDLPHTRETILKHSPTGKLPALIDGDLTVWDSLAIIEYLAERHPDKEIWPLDSKARAIARAACAEMHSGFLALRRECPMNLFREARPIKLSPEALADAARIEALWAQCQSAAAAPGPYLFGDFSAADAFFGPVVNRLRIYGPELSGRTLDYLTAVEAHPAFRALVAAAREEPWRIAKYEAI